MNTGPLVSVIMSVYNGEKYLKDSIESILGQIYKNFEFIVIDDGSTDKTLEILNSFSDSRLKIISRKNCGLTKSLNYAISVAQGWYVARIDADDISEPNRLEVQVNYLEKHPNVVLCGAWAKFIDENGLEKGEYKVPTEYSKIKYGVLIHNPFIHSTVLIRKNILDKMNGYNEKYVYVQDYELWGRIIPKYKVVNLPLFLLKYRKLGTGITKSKNLKVRWLAFKIRLAILFRLFL